MSQFVETRQAPARFRNVGDTISQFIQCHLKTVFSTKSRINLIKTFPVELCWLHISLRCFIICKIDGRAVHSKHSVSFKPLFIIAQQVIIFQNALKYRYFHFFALLHECGRTCINASFIKFFIRAAHVHGKHKYRQARIRENVTTFP